MPKLDPNTPRILARLQAAATTDGPVQLTGHEAQLILEVISAHKAQLNAVYARLKRIHRMTTLGHNPKG